MILTLTLNPAIDLTIKTNRIVYDDRTFIQSETEHAGGKGINAAQVIHAYGGEVHAIAPIGGETGRRFARLVAASQIPVTLIPVAGETRRNFAIIDDQGLMIKLDQPGSKLSDKDLHRVEDAVREHLPGAAWLMLNGSVPPKAPPDFYARLIRLAREHGVLTTLDSSSEALRLGLEAGPTLAKPNRPEAERLLDRTILSEAQAAAAARDIQKMGAGQVILSMGSQGAIGAWDEGLLRALLPAVQTGCAIGAGDVLAAICVLGLSQGQSFPDAFRWAVAAATAAASNPGLTFAPPEQTERMKAQIELRSI
ncbi:MAG: 1-phosphofructokinase family hexose kinase [Bryobacterales bacterium]